MLPKAGYTSHCCIACRYSASSDSNPGSLASDPHSVWSNLLLTAVPDLARILTHIYRESSKSSCCAQLESAIASGIVCIGIKTEEHCHCCILRAAVCKSVSTPSMQHIYSPCMTFAPRLPLRACRRPFKTATSTVSCTSQMHNRQGMSLQSPHSKPQHSKLRALNSNRWPCLGAMAPLLIASGPSRADEVTEAATDAAAAASKATADLPPTVTFGGSFGQYDPIIAVFFYAVVAALLVLTLGVGHVGLHAYMHACMHAAWYSGCFYIQRSVALLKCAADICAHCPLQVTYLSIRNWQDSTDEKKERSMYSRSSQDRYLSNTKIPTPHCLWHT